MSNNRLDQITPRTSRNSPPLAEASPPRSSPGLSSSSATAGPSSPSQSTPLSQRARQVLRKPVGNVNRASVRIRRQASTNSIQQLDGPAPGLQDIQEESTSRRRSSSEPQRPGWHNPDQQALRPMPELPEGQQLRVPRALAEQLAPHLSPHVLPHSEAGVAHANPHLEAHLPPQQRPGLLGRATVATRNALGMKPRDENPDAPPIHVGTGQPQEEYDSDMVDLLDVIGTKMESALASLC